MTFNLDDGVFLFSSSASNRIIGAKDHASIQINIAEVTGVCAFTPGPAVVPVLLLFCDDSPTEPTQQCFRILRTMRELLIDVNRSGSPVFASAGEDGGISSVNRGAFETGLHRAVLLGSPHLFRVPVLHLLILKP